MAVTKKHVTLCQEGNKDNEYYPNIETENIPDKAVTKAKLSQAVQDDLDSKAPQSTTYTKSETDALLNQKANASDVYTKSETYTKTETNTLLSGKANTSDVYNKTATDDLLDDKADKSTTYTKDAVDTLLSGKQDTLTFDNTPTQDSTNPVKSGGVYTALGGKQDTLVSGTNIKTINNTSLLGSGDITISGGGGTLYKHTITIIPSEQPNTYEGVICRFVLYNNSSSNITNLNAVINLSGAVLYRDDEGNDIPVYGSVHCAYSDSDLYNEIKIIYYLNNNINYYSITEEDEYSCQDFVQTINL